jgi:hypothetical protein
VGHFSFAVSYTYPERVSHQCGRTIIVYQVDRHVIESCCRHEQAEPHVSTQPLMDMVRVGTGVDYQIESLQRAGTLKLKQR